MTFKNAVRAGSLAAATVLGATSDPLNGQTRVFTVSHPEWARMLLRGLDLDSAAIKSASDVFQILTWHTAVAYRGNEYERAYPLTVAREGDYTIRVRLAGEPAELASAEVSRRGTASPIASFTLRPAATAGWVEGGRVHLEPGVYSASVVLPQGVLVDSVEVTPPCVAALEPPGGWKKPQAASTTDVAVTLLKVLNKEWELPAIGTPIDLPGTAVRAYLPRLAPDSTGDGVVAGASTGVEGLVLFEVPEAGVYSMFIRGEIGAGQRWLVDGCRKTNLCAAVQPTRSAGGWLPVLTSEFSPGLHRIVVRLGPNATLDRLRIERKRTETGAYVETLRRVGFDVGEEGPISRPKAIEAMRWLKERRREEAASSCVDLPAPTRAKPQEIVIARPGKAPRWSGKGPSPAGVSPHLPAEAGSPVP